MDQPTAPADPATPAGLTLQALPSIAAVAAAFMNVPIEKWLAVAGIAFIGLQAAYLWWRWRRDIHIEQHRRHEEEGE